MHDLGAQPQEGRKTGVPGEKPSESERWTNLRPHADPGSRSRVVEVGSASDDHYANLTPLTAADQGDRVPPNRYCESKRSPV